MILDSVVWFGSIFEPRFRDPRDENVKTNINNYTDRCFVKPQEKIGWVNLFTSNDHKNVKTA